MVEILWGAHATNFPRGTALTAGAQFVAKKPNFGFEKRQKDLKKQQKREEKAEKKRLKREGGGEDSTEPTEDLTAGDEGILP